jgi:hypothetical protein
VTETLAQTMIELGTVVDIFPTITISHRLIFSVKSLI